MGLTSNRLGWGVHPVQGCIQVVLWWVWVAVVPLWWVVVVVVITPNPRKINRTL